jgi:hypothetical protein
VIGLRRSLPGPEPYPPPPGLPEPPPDPDPPSPDLAGRALLQRAVGQ